MTKCIENLKGKHTVEWPSFGKNVASFIQIGKYASDVGNDAETIDFNSSSMLAFTAIVVAVNIADVSPASASSLSAIGRSLGGELNEV
jgi:hypothetical protein